MLNREYGSLDENSEIVYAQSEIRIGNTYYPNPTKEQYAEVGKLPIDKTIPKKTGVTFIPTEYGDIVDGRIVRRYYERPFVAPTAVYSVEEVIYGLIQRGKLQAVKAVLGDLYDLITMRETVSADNEILVAEFPRIKAALVSEGILTEDDIAAILKDAEV